MEQLTDSEIKKIINQYKRKRDREKENYHNKLKCDDEWCKRNQERALNYYHENKDKKKDNYIKDKDFINSRSMFNYYKRNNRIKDFKVKYPDKCDLLKSRGIFIDEEDEDKIILSFD